MKRVAEAINQEVVTPEEQMVLTTMVVLKDPTALLAELEDV